MAARLSGTSEKLIFVIAAILLNMVNLPTAYAQLDAVACPDDPDMDSIETDSDLEDEVEQNCAPWMEAIKRYQDIAIRAIGDDSLEKATNSAMSRIQKIRSDLAGVAKDLHDLQIVRTGESGSLVAISRWKAVNERLDNLIDTYKDLDQTWYTLFVIPKDSLIRQQLGWAANPYLPQPVKDQINQYRSAIPPYFLSANPKNSPPRELLVALQREINQVKDLLTAKEEKIIGVLRTDLNAKSRKILSADYQLSRVRLSWLRMSEKLQFEEVLLYVMADVSQGIVLLGKEKIQMLNQILESAPNLLPPDLRPKFNAEIENPKKMLQNTSAYLQSIDLDLTASILRDSLESSYQLMIKESKRCITANPEREDRRDELESRYQSLAEFAKSHSGDAPFAEVYRLESEHLLESLHLFNRSCNLGTP